MTYRRTVLTLFLLCVIVRAAFVLQTSPDRLTTPWSNIGDSHVYDRFGWNLASEGVLGVGERPSAYYMPGYPVLLSMIYGVAGHVPGAARWVQVVLGSLTVFFLSRLAKGLGGERSGVFVLLGGSIYPFFVYFVTEIVTETLFLFAFSAMLLTGHRVGRTGRVADGALHGAALALATMTRSIALPMELGCLFLARPWERANRASRLLGLGIGFALLGAVWGSWIARNHAVFGESVLFDTHGGVTFHTSVLLSHGIAHEEAVPRTRREVGYYRQEALNETLAGGPEVELEADRRGKRLALELLREDPGTYLRSIPGKVAELWLNRDFGKLDRKVSGSGIVALVGWLGYAPVLVLGLVGLVSLLATRRYDFFIAFLWIFLATSAVFGILHGGKRYRVATIDPVLLVLAGWEADRLWQRWSNRRARSAPETKA